MIDKITLELREREFESKEHISYNINIEIGKENIDEFLKVISPLLSFDHIKSGDCEQKSS